MDDERLSEAVAEGLAELPPGLELAVLLAGVDTSALYGFEMALVVRAQARQVSYEQSRLVRLSRDLAKTPTVSIRPERMAAFDAHSADHLGVTMSWSRGRAGEFMCLAEDLIDRLPVVFDALRLGRIDLEKALLFSRRLALLNGDAARRVVAQLIDRAGGWTYEYLRDQLRRAVVREDPDGARNRYKKRVADRTFFLGLRDEGTASIDAYWLPAPAALEARSHLHRLASAAKAAGDPRTMMQLTVDAAMDLLRGIPFRLAPSIDPLTAEADLEDLDEKATWTAQTTPDKTTKDLAAKNLAAAQDIAAQHAAHQNAASQNAGVDGAESGGVDPEFGEPSDWWRDDWVGDSHGEPFPHHLFTHNPDPNDTPTTDSTMTGTTAATATDTMTGTAPDSAPPAGPKTSTGPAASGGPMASAGPPCPTCKREVTPTPRRGTCDITVDLRTLLNLSEQPGLVGGWGPVIADVVRQLALDPEIKQRWMFNIMDDYGRRLVRVKTTRRPTAHDRDYVRSRDLTCRFVGCRRPAEQCDNDHCIDYANDGITFRTNICSLCKVHHGLKHDLGLEYDMTINGTVYWYFPDGRLFIVPRDGLPWYVGNDLDNAPPRQPTNQIIPRRHLEPGNTRPRPAT